MTPQIMTDIFAQTGPTVALVIVLLYWLFFLQKKLISIIENNTTAMTANKQVMESVHETMKECHRGRE